MWLSTRSPACHPSTTVTTIAAVSCRDPHILQRNDSTDDHEADGAEAASTACAWEPGTTTCSAASPTRHFRIIERADTTTTPAAMARCTQLTIGLGGGLPAPIGVYVAVNPARRTDRAVRTARCGVALTPVRARHLAGVPPRSHVDIWGRHGTSRA